LFEPGDWLGVEAGELLLFERDMPVVGVGLVAGEVLVVESEVDGEVEGLVMEDCVDPVVGDCDDCVLLRPNSCVVLVVESRLELTLGVWLDGGAEAVEDMIDAMSAATKTPWFEEQHVVLEGPQQKLPSVHWVKPA
jgi:hypothetical protein